MTGYRELARTTGAGRSSRRDVSPNRTGHDGSSRTGVIGSSIACREQSWRRWGRCRRRAAPGAGTRDIEGGAGAGGSERADGAARRHPACGESGQYPGVEACVRLSEKRRTMLPRVRASVTSASHHSETAAIPEVRMGCSSFLVRPVAETVTCRRTELLRSIGTTTRRS